MLLQAHGRLSTRELAERLEVSRRTAHRDMEALCAAGIPLIALRGARGGWDLEKGWRTKVPGLDAAELSALFMAQPSALGDRRLTAAADRAFDKLMAAMPGPMRAQAASIRARLHIDPKGWWPSQQDLSQLAIVQDAIGRDARLSFTYTRPDGETGPRTVDPFGIVCKQTIWYLVARGQSGMRTYRLSRIANAVILATQFKRPANFDLAAYWKKALANIEEQRQHYYATLALAPEAAESVSRWCKVTAIADHPCRDTLPPDWLIYKVAFERKSQAHFVTLGLGPRAWALAPQQLCDEIEADIAELRTRSQAGLAKEVQQGSVS
jgi:predicted DNA-binding transcriptional regulator YafY